RKNAQLERGQRTVAARRWVHANLHARASPVRLDVVGSDIADDRVVRDLDQHLQAVVVVTYKEAAATLRIRLDASLKCARGWNADRLDLRLLPFGDVSVNGKRRRQAPNDQRGNDIKLARRAGVSQSNCHVMALTFGIRGDGAAERDDSRAMRSHLERQ